MDVASLNYQTGLKKPLVPTGGMLGLTSPATTGIPQTQPLASTATPAATPDANSSMLGLSTPTPTPPVMPTTTPGAPLDTTPDAGAKINGGNYYDQTAIDANRDYFKLWNDNQFNQDTSALEQQLRNRGIKPGDPAYNTELQRLRETQGKLRESSNLQAIQAGQQQATNLQGMDINAETSNLNRQLGVADNTRADDKAKTDEQHYNDDLKAGYIGQGVDLLTGANGNGLKDILTGGTKGDGQKGGLLGLASQAASAIGLGSKAAGAGAGLLGLGAGAVDTAGIAAAQAAALGELGAGAAGAGAAGTGAAAAGAGAAGGTGAMSTVLAAVPWVAAAVAAGAVIAHNMPKSSPMNNYDPKAGGWSKPENWGGETYPPESLNRVFGPALAAFKQSGGDVKAALAAVGQPQNELEQHMLERGLLHLFSGTGNPMRQIADENNFGKGAWTAGSDAKKQLLDELGIKQ